MDTVSTQGSILFDELGKLEPRVGANLTGGQTDSGITNSTTIYAAVLTGSCDDSRTGQTYIEGYVMFLGDGRVLQAQVWTSASAPRIDQPFSASLDKVLD